jgi:LL-diaminopimelate aminotransferase
VSLCEHLSYRIGGKNFDANEGYKFTTIKTLKREFLQRFPSVPLLDMGVGEPDEAAPVCVVEAMKIECGKRENRFYADNGTFHFLRAVADYMQEIFGVTLNPETEILHSMGIKPALSILAGCLVNAGDIVLVTTPGYPIFGIQSVYYGGIVRSLPLLPQNDFFPDFSVLSEKILEKVKGVVLNYPNNPTGRSATRSFFETCVAYARRYGWVLINDAAYAPLSFSSPLSLLAVPGAREVAVELHSMSKGFNMTGWRLGWVCGNETLVKAYGKFRETVDSGQFLAIQKAAVRGLQEARPLLAGQVEKYHRRYRMLRDLLNRKKMEYQEPGAGFFVYVKSPRKVCWKDRWMEFESAGAFSHWLLKTLGILLVPWDEAGPYVRFSLTFTASTVEEERTFFHQLEERLAECRFE